MVPGRRAAGSVQRPDRTERGDHPAEDTGGPGGEPVLCRDERAQRHGAAPDPEAEPDGRDRRAGGQRQTRPDHPAALRCEGRDPEETGRRTAGTDRTAARRFQIRHCLHRWHGTYHAAEPQPRKQPSEDRGIPDQHGIQPVGYHPGDHERYCFRCCDDQLREPHHRTHCGGCRGRDPAEVPDRGRPGEPGIRDVLP